MANKRITALTETDDPSGGYFVIDKGGASAEKILATSLGSAPTVSIEGGSQDYYASTGDVVVVTTAVDTYTLPALSSFTKYNFYITIKNLSGGDVTFETVGADTFDTGELAETSIIIPYGYTLKLFVISTSYLRTQNI